MMGQCTRERILVGSQGQTQASRVDVPVSPQEVAEEDWKEQTIEDAIVDELRVGRDDVATLRYTPTDGIQAPDAPDESGGDVVDTGDVQTKAAGVLAWEPDQVVADQEPGEEPERIKCPFIVGPDQSADCGEDCHGSGKEDCPEDVKSWDHRGEQDGQADDWPDQEPGEVC